MEKLCIENFNVERRGLPFFDHGQDLKDLYLIAHDNKRDTYYRTTDIKFRVIISFSRQSLTLSNFREKLEYAQYYTEFYFDHICNFKCMHFKRGDLEVVIANHVLRFSCNNVLYTLQLIETSPFENKIFFRDLRQDNVTNYHYSEYNWVFPNTESVVIIKRAEFVDIIYKGKPIKILKFQNGKVFFDLKDKQYTLEFKSHCIKLTKPIYKCIRRTILLYDTQNILQWHL